jgi:hypothetical protein
MYPRPFNYKLSIKEFYPLKAFYSLYVKFHPILLTALPDSMFREGNTMEELVGICHQCGKNLYCLDGFFNGVKTEDQKTLCFDCAEEEVH